MLHQIQAHLQKPALYEKSTSKFWDHEHISKKMLEAHLNPDLDAASRTHHFIEQSTRWIANTLPPIKHSHLLDLGCGPGLYAELFHHAGYQVTGVDLSRRSIQYAQQSALKKQLNIEYIASNYLELKHKQQYDLITLIYCDFGALSTDDRSTLLRKVFTMLKPGGHFLFDVFTPLQYAGLTECHDWEYCKAGGFWSEEAYLCLNSLYSYDDAQTFLRQYLVMTQGGVQCYNIWEHIFTKKELAMDMKTAGFSSTSFFGDVCGAAYTPESKTICAIAQK